MSEFMGLIRGQYEAKEDKFTPGGASLHASMTPHGPDTACYEASIEADTDKPSKIPASALAFMFETYHTPRVRTEMLSHPCLDQNYYQCWIGLKNHFDRNRKAAIDSEQRAEEYLNKRKSLDLPKSS
ncbi:hypothetical protein CYMTET_10229 [Cymbomonas tetramitiformis]|uniref:homogentisate 1,2-dioxygenase n=1 Tax=Cymbomonas tetramitiformis TaxID=36881 RepID=A0AAE0GPU9_9CHLO|nr:hypothetical protein CYMTET_10229 [Cymbomonas tetramitiformis]